MAKHFLSDNDVKILKRVVRQVLKDPSVLESPSNDIGIVQNVFMGVIKDGDNIKPGLYSNTFDGEEPETKYFSIVKAQPRKDTTAPIKLESHTDDGNKVYVQEYIDLPEGVSVYVRDAFGTLIKIGGAMGEYEDTTFRTPGMSGAHAHMANGMLVYLPTFLTEGVNMSPGTPALVGKIAGKTTPYSVIRCRNRTVTPTSAMPTITRTGSAATSWSVTITKPASIPAATNTAFIGDYVGGTLGYLSTTDSQWSRFTQQSWTQSLNFPTYFNAYIEAHTQDGISYLGSAINRFRFEVPDSRALYLTLLSGTYPKTSLLSLATTINSNARNQYTFRYGASTNLNSGTWRVVPNVDTRFTIDSFLGTNDSLTFYTSFIWAGTTYAAFNNGVFTRNGDNVDYVKAA
jgi:hypothetical protein